MEVGLAFGSQGERPFEGAANDVGQQWVVASAGRGDALGEADHDHSVEVEAGDGPEATDEHAATEATLSVDLAVESVGDRLSEVGQARSGLDRPEAGEIAE